MTPPPADLVLASTSRYRRGLLERLGLAPRCEAPDVDERALEGESRGSDGPERLAARLARAKADDVARRCPDAVVVGADQVCAVGDEILGKPGGRERAVEQLRRLRGREHRLVTAVAVRHGGEVTEFADVTRLWMRPLSDQEVERYVDADRPFDCAGSYKLEALGVALFDRIESADWTAVEGLPLIEVVRVLRAFGYRLP